MIRKETFEIQGKQVEIQQFSAVQGWKILRKITSCVGPAIGKGTMDPGMAVDVLFQRLPEAELIGLLKKLTQFVWIDGRPVNFEMDMVVGEFSLKVLTEVLRLNFEEFFLTIKELFTGLAEEVQNLTMSSES